MSEIHDHGDFLDDGDYSLPEEDGSTPPRWFLLHEERLNWWKATCDRVLAEWNEETYED